ncbi:hypothetical protein EPN42_02980 [bacterium]|nr:MAG: hypothetical protein EPN42_02980 [bacterium]
MDENHADEMLRTLAAKIGPITLNVRADNGNVTAEWYDYGNVYGCYRSAEGKTLDEALAAAVMEIQAARG